MRVNRPQIGQILNGIQAALLVVLPGSTAHARDSAPSSNRPALVVPGPAASTLVTDLALAEPDEAAPPRISFSRAADGEGKVMYARRGTASDDFALVAFSATRPRVVAARSGPAAAMSNGLVGQLPRFMPVSARVLTSGFGPRFHPILGVQRNHLGVDLAVPNGTPIAVTRDGTVSFAAWDAGYGLLVAVDHDGGVQTRYAHMSRIAVAPGQRVRTGDLLGYVGSTGLSTGPHLHYEVRVNGQAVSPFAR